MPTEQNKSIVRRYLEYVWGRGQTDLLRELMTEDIVDHDPGPGQPCGLEGQEQVTRTFLNGLSNYRMTVESVLAEGDRVVDRWTYTATQTGELWGMPATGKTFTISGTDESRIAGGKIAEIWHREDILSMLQQLGFAPAPPLPQAFGRPDSSTRPGSTTYGQTLSDQDKKALIRQGIQQLLDQGDLNSIGDYITPDFTGHYSAFPPVYGRDGFREFLSIYTTGLANRHTEIEDILVDGDRVAVRVVYHGKNTGSMMGAPASGKMLAIKSLSIFRLVGDKVAEHWSNNDDLGMVQQLGLVPQTATAEPVPC